MVENITREEKINTIGKVFLGIKDLGYVLNDDLNKIQEKINLVINSNDENLIDLLIFELNKYQFEIIEKIEKSTKEVEKIYLNAQDSFQKINDQDEANSLVDNYSLIF